MPQDLSRVFDSNAKTIKEIFGDTDSYYQIPDYQRAYSWVDEQIEALWNDILAAMNDKDESYFLGPMILVKTDDDRYNVVDGQQRLTTLTILFCVLRDLYMKGKKRIEDSIKSVIEDKYRLRLITQANHQNKFQQEVLEGVVFPSDPLSKKEKEAEKFKNAALILKNKLEIIEQKGQLSDFVNYLLNNVIMITVVCSKRSFAVKLFQVLNTRGLPLTNADLIKSHLYGQLEDDKKSKQFMATWNEIENMAPNVDESLESLFTYFEHCLLASNPKHSLYNELVRTDLFKKNLKNPNKVIYQTRKFFNGYRDVYSTDSKAVYSLWYLPNQVFWKSILATAKYKGFSDFSALCRELRRMYYSYWIAGYTTPKIKQLSFNLVGWIKNKRGLDEIRNEIDKKMSKDNVQKRMGDNLRDDAYGESWLRPLLILIEYEQTDDSKLTYIEPSRKLHVDHILPNGWESNADWRSKWTKDQADKWLQKIGNLTLLSGKKNIAARNDSFQRKKAIYKGKGIDGTTAFLISQKILYKRNWLEGHIKNRQNWITGQIERMLDVKLR